MAFLRRPSISLARSCTVKSPSQSAMETLITRRKTAKKPLVVAGCVPQESHDLKEPEGVSMVGVQQIELVVEVVKETLKGHEVQLLTSKTLPALDPQRKHKFVEILPINLGCLGACTYCKTKHARGLLGSYTVESLVDRVKAVIADGVKEIWLCSEDTGAYDNPKTLYGTSPVQLMLSSELECGGFCIYATLP